MTFITSATSPARGILINLYRMPPRDLPYLTDKQMSHEILLPYYLYSYPASFTEFRFDISYASP